jgi:NIPSNAP
MIYEWRTYEAMPGKLVALNTHLEVAAGLFQKHGLGVLGFWTEDIGTGGQITYMWVYKDVEERQQKLAAFGADAAWKQQVAEETAKEGAIVARIYNTMLQRTPYSPEPVIKTKIQEWRIYDAMPGKLPDLHTRFSTHTLSLFEKHGMENIGYWTEVFGTSNRLVYMLGYPNLGEREKSWAAFMRDPDWQQARAESEKNGTLVAKVANRILRPTAYSPRG